MLGGYLPSCVDQFAKGLVPILFPCQFTFRVERQQVQSMIREGQCAFLQVRIHASQNDSKKQCCQALFNLTRHHIKPRTCGQLDDRQAPTNNASALLKFWFHVLANGLQCLTQLSPTMASSRNPLSVRQDLSSHADRKWTGLVVGASAMSWFKIEI